MIAQENLDDILGHILPHITQHVGRLERQKPFLLALTGLQGSGKTTWTSGIVRTLNEKHKVKTIGVSLDDFYLDHEGLVRVRLENPSNKLLRVRGQPGTHDTALVVEFLRSLVPTTASPHEVLIPEFDKSRFNGEGDRVPRDHWKKITVSTVSTIDVVVLEGWCFGFQPLSESAIEEKWKKAKYGQSPSDDDYDDGEFPTRTLQNHALSSYIEINRNLKTYCDMFMGPQYVDFLVHLDTNDLMNVYRWRLEQEHALHKTKNRGMSDDQVIEFIRCYMPAYELYLDALRQGFFSSLPADARAKKEHKRVILGRDRSIVGIVTCG
jgi:D-glycerate 3-kinase